MIAIWILRGFVVEIDLRPSRSTADSSLLGLFKLVNGSII